MQIRLILHWERFKGGRNAGKGEFEWTVSPGLKKKALIKGCSAVLERKYIYTYTCIHTHNLFENKKVRGKL